MVPALSAEGTAMYKSVLSPEGITGINSSDAWSRAMTVGASV